MSEANDRRWFDGFEEWENAGYCYVKAEVADRILEHYMERVDGVIDEVSFTALLRSVDPQSDWAAPCPSNVELPF